MNLDRPGVALNHLVVAGLLLSVFTLAGCAGSADPAAPQIDSGSTTTPDPGTEPAPAPAPEPTPTPTPGADTTQPAGSVTAPANGATVAGLVTLTATVTDPAVSGQVTSGIASVQFRVDGANYGAQDTSAPYSLSWETTLAANGSHAISIVIVDKAGNPASSASISVNISNALPPPSAGQFVMPSLADEESTYRKWAWTWTTSDTPAGLTTDPYIERYPSRTYSVGGEDQSFIHSDTEGDDLWTYLHMYRRTGNQIYYKRAKAWRDYFVNEYRNSDEFEYDRDFLLDHLFGYGLVAWYEYSKATGTADAAALAEAEILGAECEQFWQDNPSLTMGNYGARQGARHLLLATELARVTGKSRWIALRDDLINRWLNSARWDETRGMYFYGSWNTNGAISSGDCQYTEAPDCPYQKGDRVTSPFQIGILTNAFEWSYLSLPASDSRRDELKRRMVKMAQFVHDYGLDPYYQYSGGSFGIVDGKIWHSYSAGCGTSCTYVDPAYTISLVNTLVRGYKYTGDRKYYDKAKVFFNRGSKGEYGSTTNRQAPDNEVAHFVDTRFASGTDYFFLDNNRGELFYTYLIFENGGL